MIDGPILLTDRPRPAVRVQRRYDHTIDLVWRAVTSPPSLAQWFPSQVDFELVAGGNVRYDMRGTAYSGVVHEVDSPRRLVFTWDDDQLEFDLRADGDGTIFVLTHLFSDRAGAASFATGWEICLAALRAVLAGDELPAPRRGLKRHEELARRFGLDDPEVTRTELGWRLSFERQLVCTAETAWDLFFGSDPVTGVQRQAPMVGGEFRPSAAPEILLGVVTVVEAPREYAIDIAAGVPGDSLRLRLGAGTGHGARLFLEVEGGVAEELEPAIDTWGRGAVGRIAREAARLASE